VKLSIRYAAAIGACGIILLALAAVEGVLMSGTWRPFDIASYYGLAGSAVSSIEAVLGSSSSQAMVEFFGGGPRLFVVSILLWACAALVIAIGGRLFGDIPGCLAGLLFALSAGGAQGNLAAGEALALALALASVYLVLCDGKHYLAAGLLAGAAACMKPLAIILLPLSLLYMRRRWSRRDMAAYGAAWALLPILAFVFLVMLLYGYYGGQLFTLNEGGLPAMAAYHGFSAFGFLSDDGIGLPDALMTAANIALAACMLVSLLPLALLGFSRIRGPEARFLLAAGLLFIASLLVKQYLRYWLFALPFLVLLCASAFARRPGDA